MKRAGLLTFISALLLMLAGLGAGCQTADQTAQNGALVRARAAIEHKDYKFALQRLDAAETYHQPSADVQAEILYLKGICLELLQQLDEARLRFKEAAGKFPNTAFGIKAREKLSQAR